jgi:hypothetical protein
MPPGPLFRVKVPPNRLAKSKTPRARWTASSWPQPSRKTVELYLPRSAESAAEAQPENHLSLRRAASGEVVLVVEDEPAVLEMAVESLGELDYRTLTATQASKALERRAAASASTSCSRTGRCPAA